MHINMNYYLFNRQELLPKAKDRYYDGGSKEKAAKYYLENKKVLQENSKNKYKNVSEEKKKLERYYRRNRFKSITED